MKLFMKGNTLKMNPLGAIELTGMEFHAYHGCLESERTEGNTFDAAQSDSLDKTQDYAKVYRIIQREMEKPSNLLEAVAGRIVDAIARETEDFVFIQVRVAKKNPPVGGACGWSRVTASWCDDLSAGDLSSAMP